MPEGRKRQSRYPQEHCSVKPSWNSVSRPYLSHSATITTRHLRPWGTIQVLSHHFEPCSWKKNIQAMCLKGVNVKADTHRSIAASSPSWNSVSRPYLSHSATITTRHLRPWGTIQVLSHHFEPCSWKRTSKPCALKGVNVKADTHRSIAASSQVGIQCQGPTYLTVPQSQCT